MSRPARSCSSCKRDFFPRRLVPRDRQCHRCRTGFMVPVAGVEQHGSVRTYHLGLLGGSHHLVAHQASVMRERLSPRERAAVDLDAVRRRHLPTPAEHHEDVMAAERLRIRARLTPSRAALFAALED